MQDDGEIPSEIHKLRRVKVQLCVVDHHSVWHGYIGEGLRLRKLIFFGKSIVHAIQLSCLSFIALFIFTMSDPLEMAWKVRTWISIHQFHYTFQPKSITTDGVHHAIEIRYLLKVEFHYKHNSIRIRWNICLGGWWASVVTADIKHEKEKVRLMGKTSRVWVFLCVVWRRMKDHSCAHYEACQKSRRYHSNGLQLHRHGKFIFRAWY